MALRRERERQAVLAEAVAEMRRRGKTEFEAKDLFMDFRGIQVTLAVMAQALIDGRIDCKTAGRLAVGLQMASKLLRIIHREGRKENERSPRICADERGLSREKASTTKETRLTPLFQRRPGPATEHAAVEMRTVEASESSGNADRFRIAEVIAIGRAERTELHSERAHGPPEWVNAA